jgi:hypothetical protein
MASSPVARSSETVSVLASSSKSASASSPHAHQAYRILHLGFVVAPALAGLDKYFNLLAQWDQYLAPIVPRLTGLEGPTFMKIVGLIEIVAAIGVALKPRIFAYVVAAWLVGIIGNLLMTGQYFDVALRDLGLALGALALARLSHDFDRS